MDFSDRDFSFIFMCLEGLFGAFLAVVSIYLLKHATAVFQPVSYVVPGVILMVVGVLSIISALETFLLFNGPDSGR